MKGKNKKDDLRESVNAPRGIEVERTAEDEREQLWRLTPREREVYRLLAKSNKEISSALGIEVRTVRFHVSNILRKFDVPNRIEILAKDWPQSQ